VTGDEVSRWSRVRRGTIIIRKGEGTGATNWFGDQLPTQKGRRILVCPLTVKENRGTTGGQSISENPEKGSRLARKVKKKTKTGGIDYTGSHFRLLMGKLGKC